MHRCRPWQFAVVPDSQQSYDSNFFWAALTRLLARPLGAVLPRTAYAWGVLQWRTGLIGNQTLAHAASIMDVRTDNLTLCELEPITRLERVQSFGFLLAMTRSWIVTRASANLAVMLGVEVKDALGKTLDALLDTEALHDMRNRMSGLSVTGGIERMYGVKLVEDRGSFDIAIHYVAELCVLEGEPAGLDSRIDAASLVRKMVARLNMQPSLDAFHRDAARQVRGLTGFDRVMIYRFAADGAGEVIAEVTKAGMEGYLGLFYPASDIPVQARALYLRNSFRIIADVNSPAVPLQSADAALTEPMDLSLAITRAVSPVHIEYLVNMGVGASMSISVIIEGKLWGLIACHHTVAKLPSFVTRTAAELFGQMYSMTLESRLRSSADDQDRYGRQAVAKLVKAIAANESLLRDAGWLQDAMRDLIHCDGIAVAIGVKIVVCGATPPTPAIESLRTLVDALSSGEVFATDNLGALQPMVFNDPGEVAGVLCIPMSGTLTDHIMLFRREQLRTFDGRASIQRRCPQARTPFDYRHARVLPYFWNPFGAAHALLVNRNNVWRILYGPR